jgi:cytochrome c553
MQRNAGSFQQRGCSTVARSVRSTPAVHAARAATADAQPSTSGRDERIVSILIECGALTEADVAAAAPALAGADEAALRASLTALAARFKPRHVRDIAVGSPQALRLDLKSWITFLEVRLCLIASPARRLAAGCLQRGTSCCSRCPELLRHCPAARPDAGRRHQTPAGVGDR